MSTLDLEVGDEDAADAISSRAKRQQARKERRAAGDTPAPRKRSDTSEDGSLLTRITDSLQRIAEQLEAKGDSELAEAISEDARKMAQGLVSLTRGIPVLRQPLVILLGLVEPILAFFRVGRILVLRVMARRQRAWEEAQAQEQEQNPAYPSVASVG